MSKKKSERKPAIRPREVKFAFWDALKMVINGIVIGFAFIIATLLSEPILAFIESLGVQPSELAMLITVSILFIIVVILVMLLIFINRNVQKYKI